MQMVGSPYTPAGAGGFSSPRGNLTPALAAQTPGQLAATLRAQNKSYDDVVLELADMVGWHERARSLVSRHKACGSLRVQSTRCVVSCPGQGQ